MGMSSPTIPGQVINITSEAQGRVTSKQDSPLRNPSNASSVVRRHDTGLNQRAANAQAGYGGPGLTRKKLPWLRDEAPIQSISIPGSFDESKSSLEKPNTSRQPAPGRRATIKSLGNDLSLRPVGSDPTLGDRPKSREQRRVLSLSSEYHGHARRMQARDAEQRHFSVQAMKSKHLDDYTTSEYSTTISSDHNHPPSQPTTDILPPSLLRTGASSYECLGRASNADISAPRLISRTSIPPAIPSEWSIAPPEWTRDQSPAQPAPVIHTMDRRREIRLDYGPLDPSQVREPRRGTMLSKPKPPAKRTTAFTKPPPARKQTLYDMPSHLMASSASTSPDNTAAQTRDTEPPARGIEQLNDLIRHDAQRRPTQLSPKAILRQPEPVASQWRGLRRVSRSLSRAITGMENMMEDALQVARDAAHDGRTDDVAHVLDSATTALKKANAAVPRSSASFRVPRDGPLQLSPHESGPSSSSSDSDLGPHDDRSTMHTREHSASAATTMLTKSAKSSAQPIVSGQYTKRGKAVASQRASMQRASFETSSDDGHHSLTRTPPRLYQAASADSIVRDFAYNKALAAQASKPRSLGALPRVGGRSLAKSKSVSNAATAYGHHGAASDFYHDDGESIACQPGVRQSIAHDKSLSFDKSLPPLPPSRVPQNDRGLFDLARIAPSRAPAPVKKSRKLPKGELTLLEHAPIDDELPIAPHDNIAPGPVVQRKNKPDYHPHVSDFFDTAYYRHPETDHRDKTRKMSSVTDTRSVPHQLPPPTYPQASPAIPLRRSVAAAGAVIRPPSNLSLKHPVRRKHISLNEGQGFSLGRYHRRAPIAREWTKERKRLAATVVCVNTAFIGLIAGIYAGEVPRIQYQIQDMNHRVILGNVLLFLGLGLTTLIFWPLPLLHGRKPYTLLAFALMLPLQFPQALAVSTFRDPNNPLFRCGLLIPRAATGLAMGFANINQLPTLFDLFGCSLMSEAPHQEVVVSDDVRRQGGGVGIWLGIWSFCFVGSISIGFCIGACIISSLDPSWGFYIVVILLAFFLLVNVVTPETRRAPYRRSIAHFFDESEPEKLKRRVARGEVKLHISNEGPKYWWQEVWAGIILTTRMVRQPGYFVLMLYIGWIYAQVTLVILLLGALLSRDYSWQPQYVGLAALSLAVGALLAVPLAKASLLSRSRFTPQRTDSMTMRAPRLTWSSHLIRRCIFTLLLPFAALAYTLTAPGPSVNWSSPTIFCGLVGFLSNLAIAECVGLIMEVFDTCDLQPGVNTKHRLQSMTEITRRRRTNYSSFPRVCAGFFAAQSLGFFFAAAATGVSGIITRALGAQVAVACVAGILLIITVFFMCVMFRCREVQVVPNGVFDRATRKGSVAWGPGADDPEWKPVIIGNPSGKMRRVNLLELANLSRWTEIRRLNKLVRH
ncbi:hypothetical protein LTR78_007363 [Recurvomyces mirabilis]|uniref:Polyamine transport protein n=1 Tax=Recurvomyces mirabilis TaxID=574656 RepID=A0AAE0WJB9_9PEZI|nr:hypothetical protein LTR78_007363 [Recurvomyces mirabilis]